MSVSGSLRLGLPIGKSKQENGLQTGDGELNQMVGLAVGRSLWPRPGWVQAEAAFNNRVNGYSDEFLYKLEAGYTVVPRITLIARVRGALSFRNGVDERLGGTGGLYGNNQRYLAYGLEVVYSPKEEYGGSIRVEGATFGENVLAAPALGASVFLRK